MSEAYVKAQRKYNNSLKERLPKPLLAKKIIPAWGVRVNKDDVGKKLETLEGTIEISASAEVVFMGPGILDYTKNNKGASFLATYSERFNKSVRNLFTEPFGSGQYRTDFYTFKNIKNKYTKQNVKLVIHGLTGLNSWLNGRTMFEYKPKGKDATSLKKVYVFNKKFKVYTDWAKNDNTWKKQNYQIATSATNGGILATWNNDNNTDLVGDVWIINKALFEATHVILSK